MEENGVEEYFINFFVYQKIKGDLKNTDSWPSLLEADLIS